MKRSFVIDWFADIWNDSKRFRIGVLMVVAGLLVSLIAGVPLGALVVLFIIAGGFAVGGALFESIINRKPRVITTSPSPMVQRTQPFFFVSIGRATINLAQVTCIYCTEKDCVVSQSDGEPLHLSADEEKQLMAVVNDYAVTVWEEKS